MGHGSDIANIASLWAPPLIAVATFATLFALILRFAVPRGRTRPVRAKVLLRAILPSRIIASASGRADIAWFLFGIFFSASALGWACWSGDWFADRFEAAYTLLLGPAPALRVPAWIATSAMTLALFLAYEFAYWLNHSLSHRVGWMWEFHKVHHTAESLTPMTNFRVHPVDTIIFFNMAAVMGGLAMATTNHLLGSATQGYLLYGLNALTFLATILFSYLQHTHLWISFSGRAGRWLLSPAHHQVHHSVDPRHHDRNFGSTIAIFDRLFGTLYIPAAKREALRFGVDGIAYDPHSPQGAVLHPFLDAARRFVPPGETAPTSSAVADLR
ncbi:MAG: sterol desaturase family protein [Sphingomonadales bacterium]|nr:sterol desaturase family protein [Sphingomonadales bacterium]